MYRENIEQFSSSKCGHKALQTKYMYRKNIEQFPVEQFFFLFNNIEQIFSTVTKRYRLNIYCNNFPPVNVNIKRYRFHENKIINNI